MLTIDFAITLLPFYAGNCFAFYFNKIAVLFLCRKEDSDLYESVEHLDQTDQEAKNYSFVEKSSNNWPLNLRNTVKPVYNGHCF